MNASIDLERRLEAYLALEAPTRAPDRVLAVAIERVGGISQRRRPGRDVAHRLGVAWRGMTVTRRAALVLAVLVLTAVTVAAAALLLRPPTRAGSDLIVLRPLVPDDPGQGVDVVAIEPDGRERQLRRIGPTDLEGPPDGNGSIASNGLLAMGIAGGPDGSTAVVDLRAQGAAPRYPDTDGFNGNWDPTGTRLVAQTNEAFQVIDLQAPGSDRVTPPKSVWTLPNTGYAPTWTAAGDGVLVTYGSSKADDSAPGGVRPPTRGVLGFDGRLRDGLAVPAQTGVGPRRIRDDGVLLRCRPDEDDRCLSDDATLWAVGADVTAALVETDPDRRIADFAWAADGGLWVLLETTGPSDRVVRLVHVATTGEMRVVVTMAAGADDADPNSYCPGASFVAMAPDDIRFVIRTAGQACGSGPTLLIDAATGASTPLIGTVAGWLDATALTRPLPTLGDDASTPVTIRGGWGRSLPVRQGAIPEGGHRLSIGRTSAEVDVGFGQMLQLGLVPMDADRIRMTQPGAAIGCPAGSTATYAWAGTDDGITLTALDEACPDRAALLEGAWDPTLELGGDHEGRAREGTTYFVPEIGAHVTIPADEMTTVWSRTTDDVSLGMGSVSDDGYWILEWPSATAGAQTRGLTQALDYLASRSDDFTLEDRVDTTIDGRPAVTGRLRLTKRPHPLARGRIWPDQDFGGGFALRDGARLTILTGPDDRVYSLLEYVGDDASTRWADALTESLRFLPPDR